MRKRYKTLKRFIAWAKILNCNDLNGLVDCLERSEFNKFSISEAVLKMYALGINNGITNSKTVRLIIPKY